MINQEKLNMDFQNELNRLQEMMNHINSNQDPPVDLYHLEGSDKRDNKTDSLTKEPLDTLLMGDGVISTILARKNDEFIKSSVDDLVPIPRESEVTSDNDLECDIHATTLVPTTDVREENFDINSPLGEYVVDFLMENEDVAGLPRHLVKQIFNQLLKNPSLTKGMSNEPLGDDSKPRSYDVSFSNPLFDFNDDSTLCYNNPLFDEGFEDISSLDLPELTPVIDESTLLVTLPSPYLVVLGDEKIDLLLRDDLDTLSTGDREIDFNSSRDIEELERLLADDPVPVPKVFNEPLGNSDSMSRSSETSDLFEELIAEFGLDDSIPTEIDDRYHDSEGDIIYFEQLLNEDTSSDVSPALLPTESSSLDLPLLDPKQICLREVERFDPFFSLTQSGGNTRVMETLSFGFHHMPSPHPAAYSPTEVMYCYYHPHLTTGDGFDLGTKRFPMILKTSVLVFDSPITRMRMEQYLTHTDYALWEVIVNGDAPANASASAGTEGPIPPKTAKQKLARKNELKAKSTLLLAIPNEHLLKFHGIKDKQYENFTTSRSKGLDKTQDRFQKLISQLEIHGEVISQKDANLKFLRSLPSAWNNIALIMRNKSDLYTLSMDDLYNNLNVYESEIKVQSSSSLNSQNVVFVSLENTSSTNESVNTAHEVSAANLEQIDTDDLEGKDLKWQVAMLTMRVKIFLKKTVRNLNFNGKETVGFDKTKGNRNGDGPRRNGPVDTSTTNALVVQDGLGYQMGLESLEARIVIHEKNEAIYEEDIAFLKYDVQVKDISIKDLKNQLEESLKEKDDLKLKLEKRL
ncbi:hypothetical protein Tco_0906659 [Tanacetum coccineum]|uniref:Uncharacterized protein n=1 Tax=Tanacetum coccineum TaxID=301880 RepID=A0ABQ5CN96_9ASTR